MPSKPAQSPLLPGTLHIVATPIGNPKDITLRAIEALESAVLVAAEDTRETGALLARLDIHTRMVSFHEHNETERTTELIERLMSGADLALVSDAGTPGISDPGYRLVSAARQRGIPVTPVPGPSAATAALCVAGLPTDAFVFVGFLPKKAGGRKKRLTALSAYPETLIFFESPRRILRLIAEVREIMGDREGFLAREMTKPHETFYRGRLSAVEAAAAEGGIRGECTLLVTGASPMQKAELPDAAAAELTTMLLREPLSEAVRAVAKKYCLSRKIVYNAALEMREKSGSSDTSKSPEPDTENCCNTKK